jgi:isoleucyl-tRNA synthetase
MNEDKLSAYQTLYTCLETVAKLAAPFAPFISDRIFCDLNALSERHSEDSVHLASFPKCDESLIDGRLEDMMAMAQQVSSMVLALRRKVNIKVRQPLAKVLIPVLDDATEEHLSAVKSLILNEVNIKDMELIRETTGLITKRIKPNFKTLGPRYGKYMKQIAALVATFDQQRIAEIETSEKLMLEVAGEQLEVTREDFEITSEDMPGWLVASEGKLTVALDITVTDELRREGVARELINRIQNLRKDSGLEVTDKIAVEVEALDELSESLAVFGEYVAQQVLAVEIKAVAEPAGEFTATTDLDEKPLRIALSRR